MKKLIMIPIFLCTVLLNISCAPADVPRPYVKEEYLKAALNEWINDMKTHGINYDGLSRVKSITMVNRHAPAGEYDRATHHLTISYETVEAGPYSLLGVLYHELGHGAFSFGHSANAIMREQSYQEREWKANWPVFKQEYLNDCKQHNESIFNW